MLARFFIDRPIFAWVISIVILLGGLAAAWVLPVAQYPEITPPTVEVRCAYPGASATVVQDTIAAPIEQQVNGVEKMLYMSSQCSSDGSYVLTVTFALGTNLDMAQVLVQNRVSQALPTLPDVVQATGVTVKKRSPSILLAISVYSEEDPDTQKPLFDQLYLSNYATIQLKDELLRVNGVGDVTFLGQQDYSMRVWLNPERLAARELQAGDVIKALREQNVQVAAGKIGQPPVPAGQEFQYSMNTQGRLIEAEQFGEIVVRQGADGRITRLADVARIELGARNQDTECRLDGRPAVSMACFQLPGSNALQTADRIRAKMHELEKSFPKGIKYAIAYDTTPFIDESVHEVFKTLRDAVVLVAIVVLLFLQDWKSLLLPLIDVAVSLVGTFAVMTLLGFSLNNLTLFGLVLAIGIVVDDAIVVLENIERWIGMGYKVREATIRAMDEVTGPIIAITLVLCSVFLPSAFLGGISGQFYRQFALTIAASMLISATNAMTMTPARAASVFKDPDPHAAEHGHHREALPWWGVMLLTGALLIWIAGMFIPGSGDHGHGHEETSPTSLLAVRNILLTILFVAGCGVGLFIFQPVNRVLAKCFGVFNRWFERVTNGFGALLKRMLRVSTIVMLVYGGMLFLTYVGLTSIPVGFIPSQDKGYLLLDLQLPDAASLERTSQTLRRIEKMALETKGVKSILTIPGQSFVANGVSSNFGAAYLVLDPFHDRRDPALGAESILGGLRKRMAVEIVEGRALLFGAPPVDGLGSAGGFKLMVEDRGAQALETLAAQADAVAAEGAKQPGLVGLMSGFRASTPQLYVDVDRTKCKMLGVAMNDVFDTLQAFLGGYYVNDFNRFGRTWQVNVQAEAPFRLSAESIREFKVRNKDGKMVPLGSVAEIRDDAGPILLTRYNMYPASPINGASLPGVSTGTIISTMDAVAGRQLPSNMKVEWTELTFLQLQEGSSAIYAFLGAVILVFLVLAAQYESWSMPFAVVLVVPMCLLSACIGIYLAKMDLNIFVQVGFIVLVGLASKNAILVVEFARQLQREGKSAADAALESAKTRLRPIVMTSFAFILGVFPLVIGVGAGAEMRRTLGTAVFAGMLGVTFFGVFLTPVFYTVIMRLSGQEQADKPTAEKEPPTDVA